MNRVFLFLFVLVFSTLLSSSFAQDATNGKSVYAVCIQCHGEKGEGNPAQKAPKISGQHDWYTVKQITEIKSGVRKNPEMLPFVINLTEQDIKDLSAYILTL